MNDDQFTKLFGYMQERFDSVDKKLDQKADKADIDGNEQRYDGDINGCVITNGLIHDELISLIKESRDDR